MTNNKFKSKNWNSQRACWGWAWKAMIKHLTLNFWINISRCCGVPETCLMGQNILRPIWANVQPQNQANRTHSGFTVAINAIVCYDGFFGSRCWAPKICIILYAVLWYFFPILIFVAWIAMDCLRAAISPFIWMYTHTTNKHSLILCLLYWNLIYYRKEYLNKWATKAVQYLWNP